MFPCKRCGGSGWVRLPPAGDYGRKVRCNSCESQSIETTQERLLRSLCVSALEIIDRHNWSGIEDTALCKAMDLLAKAGNRKEITAAEIADLRDALERHGP